MSVRVRVAFRKEEGARFLSHLDLMATLEYSIRRARLPVELSAGFTPRPRFSLAAPLPLGYLGENEILEMTFHRDMEPAEIAERLQGAVPGGLVVTGVTVDQAGGKSAASQVIGAAYRIELERAIPDLAERVAELLTRPRLPVREERMDGIRTRDLRPLIRGIEADDGGTQLRLEVALDSEGTARPEQILDALGIERGGATIIREGLRLRR